MSAAEIAHILKKKESILSLEKFLDRKIFVFVGSREIRGTLKGFDNNVNVFLTEAKEYANDAIIRSLGTCVIRGKEVTSISTADTVLLTKNPFE